MSNQSASGPNRPTPPHSSSTTPQPPHHSLPARPPPSVAGPFKPASSATTSATNGAPGTASYSKPPSYNSANSAFTAFKPRNVASSHQDWRSSHSTATAAGAAAATAPPSTGYTASMQSYPMSYGQQTHYSNAPQQQQQQQQSHQQYYRGYGQSQPTPPQIQNPFPAPSQSDQQGSSSSHGPGAASQPGYDPEMEAQIAQWQSAYASKDEAAQPQRGNRGVGPESAGGANAVALGSRNHATSSITNQEAASAAKPDSGAAAALTGPDGKQKTVVRSGGGQTWQDTSLLEWDPAHFRLFVGNLAGEVTDDSLLKAFSKYDSVQKARVVRDKRTTKSKGYGFVSFSNGDQYFQAAKEMQGKYIGSHPVLLRRSTTEIRPTVIGDKNKKNKGNKGNKHNSSNNGNSNSGSNPGANTGAGVSKKPAKTKGGLKILG